MSAFRCVSEIREGKGSRIPHTTLEPREKNLKIGRWTELHWDPRGVNWHLSIELAGGYSFGIRERAGEEKHLPHLR